MSVPDDLEALEAQLIRLRAERGIDIIHRCLHFHTGLWACRVTGPDGIDREHAAITHPAATLAALHALPDGAGVDAAWDAL